MFTFFWIEIGIKIHDSKIHATEKGKRKEMMFLKILAVF